MEKIDQLKLKYIRRQATETETQTLRSWLVEHPDEKKSFYHEKDIWDSYAFTINSEEYLPDIELQKLQQQIDNRKHPKLVIPGYLKVAAIFVLAFLFSWFTQTIFFRHGVRDVVADTKEVFVPKGQIHQIFLSDGSRIWLNSESTMTVPSVFTGDERIVQLSGEAFFEVAKDPDHPFKVMVQGQTIEVLGTSFNVRAYADAPVIQTTLKTGKIELKTNQGNITLSPGEQTELVKRTGEVILKKVDPATYFSWKEGRYELKNENLIEVFKVVERWYDVTLEYNKDDFKDMYYSVVLKRNKPIEHFLQLLNHSIPIKYEVNMDEIIIQKK